MFKNWRGKKSREEISAEGNGAEAIIQSTGQAGGSWWILGNQFGNGDFNLIAEALKFFTFKLIVHEPFDHLNGPN